MLGLALALAGCDFFWDLANRGGLRRDLMEILGRYGASDAELTCNMIGTTRDGICALVASSGQVSAVVRGLGLSAVEPGDGPRGVAPTAAWERDDGCRGRRPFKERSGVRLYRSDSRPSQLRVSNGGAFQYLLLYHHPASNAACIQVSYAYG